MQNFNTFFVLSNINTVHTKFSPDQRFIQTIETFESILDRAPGSKVVFTDNSENPLTPQQISIISRYCDLVVEAERNLYTRHVNTLGKNKGINELLVYQQTLAATIKNNLVGRRIFKISGRYKLTGDFNILEYNKPQYYGKYAFKIVPWVYNEGNGNFVKHFFNTALWSMCSTLVEHYNDLMYTMFNYMLTTGENIEMAHNKYITADRLHLVSTLGGDGFITNGEYTKF
jgi:hypothetical protein